MKLFNFTIAIFLLIAAENAFSDELRGKVSGKSPEGEISALEGARIQWLNSNIGVISKENGIFKIERPDEHDSLIVAFIGYRSDTIKVADKNYIEIQLISDLITDEITVEGKDIGTKLSKSEMNTQEITAHGLQKAACCNLSESFVTNASVDVETTDAVSGAKQIKLLGLDGGYTQIMSEKVPAVRGMASAFGLQYIPGPWMESILISKGASSVQTGFESITGQINVEYRKPHDEENVHLNFFGNHLGRVEANGIGNYHLSDDLSTSLLFNGNMLDFKWDGNGDGFLDVPMVSNVNLMNRWTYDGPDMRTQFALRVLEEDRQGGQMDFYPNENPNYYGMNLRTSRYEGFWKGGYFLDDEGTSIAMISNYAYHDQHGFFGKRDYAGKQKSASLTLGFIKNFEIGSDDEHENHTGHDDHEEHKEHEKSGINMELSAGLSFYHDDYSETFADQRFLLVENVPGSYLEAKWSDFWNMTLTTGLRLDHHNIYGWFATPRVHLKYKPDEKLIFRASAGKGTRTPLIYSQHIGLMASSREFIIEDDLRREIAWNYGVNMTWDFEFLGRVFTLNADYYRTDFENQLVVDLDRSAEEVIFGNLEGESFSNSFQVDLIFDPIDDLAVTTAYRLNDVRTTYHGELLQKPLVSKHKAFVNFNYKYDEWEFDFTSELNGGGRLPSTKGNPEQYRLDSEYPAFVMLYAQITRQIGPVEIYLGSENLTDYKQPYPILAADQPFGKYFDSSMIWAPIHGVTAYMGVRMNFN